MVATMEQSVFWMKIQTIRSKNYTALKQKKKYVDISHVHGVDRSLNIFHIRIATVLHVIVSIVERHWSVSISNRLLFHILEIEETYLIPEKISISPTNFRSLISDIMNFVVDYGTVDITEIVIPKNMNKNNW